MTPFERDCDTDKARACYRRIEKRLRAARAWRDEYALGLTPVAAFAAVYLRDAHSIPALRKTATPKLARELDALLKQQRLARRGVRLFIALPPASLNTRGEDAEIAKLCAPLPKLIAPLD